MKNFCVILGAGASKDSWNNGGPPRKEEWMPPVAAELFRFGERLKFADIASAYPGVSVLASDLGELGGTSLEAKFRTPDMGR